MNIALVSLLTNGSDLAANVGVISLTVNDKVNVWVVDVAGFKAGASRYSQSQPQQTEQRIEALDGLVKEGWPKVKMSTALEDISDLIKECKCPFVVWDFDPVSFIDSHAFLWTAYPDLRASIRRIEGQVGNFFLSMLGLMKGLDQGYLEYNGFYSVTGRAAKAHSLMYKYMSVLHPEGGWKNAPKIDMRSIKDRESETLMAPPALAIPTAATLPLNIPSSPLAMPGDKPAPLAMPGMNLPGIA